MKTGAAWSADAANSLLTAAWVAVRAASNFELTKLALAAAAAGGGSCSLGAELFWMCTGVSAINSINPGGITLGNVYMLG